MKIIAFLLSVVLAFSAVTVRIGCGAKAEQPKAVKNVECNSYKSDVIDYSTGESIILPAVEIVVDETDSSDYTILKPKLNDLGKSIETKRISQVVSLRLGEGGQTAWATAGNVSNLPLSITGGFNENAALDKMEQRCVTRLPCREQRLEKMRQCFGISKTEKNKTIDSQRQLEINQITDFLLAPPKGAAPCSDLSEFRDRLVSDGFKRVIVFSDGWHDCKTPIAVKTFSPDVKVLVLIMPLPNEHSGPAFAERKASLQKIFNGENVVIMPAASATTETFNKFLE